MDRFGSELGQSNAGGIPDVERLSVERHGDAKRRGAEKALPGQPDGYAAALGVALEKQRHLGGGARDVQPLPRARQFVPVGIEGPRDELVRRQFTTEVHVERPGSLLESAGGATVELERDRDGDGMGSENEPEKKRGERDRGQLAIVETAAGRRPFARAAEIRFLGRSVMRTIQSPKPSLASSTRYARISGSS